MNTTNKISEEILCADIKEIAKLSKIALTDKESAELTKHIRDMLEYSEILVTAQKDIDNSVSSDEHSKSELRCDIPVQSLPRDILLQNAPEKENGLIAVPKFLDA